MSTDKSEQLGHNCLSSELLDVVRLDKIRIYRFTWRYDLCRFYGDPSICDIAVHANACCNAPDLPTAGECLLWTGTEYRDENVNRYSEFPDTVLVSCWMKNINNQNESVRPHIKSCRNATHHSSFDPVMRSSPHYYGKIYSHCNHL